VEQFLNAFFNIDTLAQYWPIMLRGLGWTALLCVTIVPLGLVSGATIASVYALRLRGVNPLIIGYVDFFRSFPPLVLLVFIYNGLPFVGFDIPPFAAVVLALVLNSSSYYGEIFRAGIESIPRGQVEAARSTGLGTIQTLIYIVLPQAVRNVLPPLTSNTLELVKATSLASVVAMPELLRSARIVQGLAYNPTPLIAAALVYFLLLWPLVRLVSRLERGMVASNK
jgi:polar amino acid transport system permease protein